MFSGSINIRFKFVNTDIDGVNESYVRMPPDLGHGISFLS